MTAKSQVEHVVDARHLAAPPTVSERGCDGATGGQNQSQAHAAVKFPQRHGGHFGETTPGYKSHTQGPVTAKLCVLAI